MRLTRYESTTSPARLCQLFFHAVELFVFFYYKQKQLIHRRYLPDRRGRFIRCSLVGGHLVRDNYLPRDSPSTAV